jgi:hypothetical protein
MDQYDTPAFSVKYWATAGILPVQGRMQESGRFMTKTANWYQSLSKNEFAYTVEDAKEMAEKLRAKKLVSLQKQLDKVRTMTIKVPA